MNYAINTQTGKVVDAYQVTHCLDLICPLCRKSVHYRGRKNGHKSPHFAHNKGKGTPACENYHPSHPSTSHQSTFYQNEFHLDIVLSKATLKAPAWHLAIAQKSTKTGYFTIKQGLMGEVHASFSTQTKRIVVKTQDQDYQIEISDSSNSEYVVKMTNIFTHKGDHGRSLSSHKYLYWGEQYFLVLQKNSKLACPPEIIQRMLAPQENWECIEIQLPNKPNKLITDWVERSLERQIQAPAITLSLVTPPIYRRDEDTIQIKDSDEVVIAVTDSLGNYICGTLEIENQCRQSPLSIAGTSPILIDLGYLRLGKTTLKFNSSSKLKLNCIRFQDNLTLPSTVSLTFQDGFTTDAYSLKIRECLQIKNNPLKQIEFPVAMRFGIQTQSQHFFVKPQSSESLEKFQERALQAINEIIKTEKEFVQLDFGNFGQPLLRQAPPIIVESEYTKKVIQQIQWLANLGHAQPGQQATGMRMLHKVSHGELKNFLQKMNRASLPAAAEPYLRTLATKLKKELR
ncbi:MAG: hypothetical protein ABFS56_21110 [Pseudomonadota bacterium]